MYHGRSSPSVDVAGIARGGGANLFGAIVSQVGALAVTILLARSLGKAAVGVYAQVFAFLPLLGLLSLAGFRAGMTRFVAMYRATGDDPAVVGTVRLGLTASGTAGLACGVALALASDPLARLLDEPDAAEPLRIVAIALPFHVLTEAALSATQGFRTMRWFAGIGLVLEPAVRTAATFVFVAAGLGVPGALGAVVVSNVLACAAACVALARMMPRPRDPVRYPVGEVFSFSVVSWVASLAATGITYVDVLIIGSLMSSADVGLYQVATRTVMIAYATMLPVVQAVSPRLADAHGRGDRAALHGTYRIATSWIIRSSLPVFVILVTFPGDVLALFGDPFRAGATVTVVLSAGKLVDAATGPCGLVLNMAGRVRTNMVNNVVALALDVALDLLLVPRMGIAGAAVSWAVTLVVVNLARALQVERAFGFRPLDRSSLEALVPAGVAIGLLYGLRLAGVPTSLEVGLVVTAVTFAAAYLLRGAPEEDRALIDALRARRAGRVAP